MPNRTTERIAILTLLLLAAYLRVVALDDTPPGWRDDEITETSVHARVVLDGGRPLFFVQAEGHEPLYHYLSAGTIALLGEGLFQVRLLSAAFGLLGVAALYRLARRWFGGVVALIACAATALSFWSLMYSRTKIRHVSELVFILLAFHFFRRIESYRGGRGEGKTDSAFSRLKSPSILAGLFLALGLYTYYASRAAPVILAGFVAYLLLFHRRVVAARWKDYALALAVAAVLSAPLLYAERAVGGGAQRLAVVGAPLKALLSGDAQPLIANTLQTLGMFGFTGDPEALYNIPGRPVFGPLALAFFIAGLLVALWRWRQPAYGFLLLWLLGGLAPSFASTPSASLGHAITAQPAAYLFPAVAVAAFGQWWAKRPGLTRGRSSLFQLPATLSLALVFLVTVGVRDLGDYFREWPSLPEVRFLYRADLHAAAQWLRAHPDVGGDLAVSSSNVDPRSPVAYDLELPGRGDAPRFFDPARALVFPRGSVSTTVILGHTPIGEYFAEHYEADLSPAASAKAPNGGTAFTVYRPRLPNLPPIAPGLMADETFVIGLTFRGLDSPAEARPGSTIAVLTHWLVDPIYIPLPLRDPFDPAQKSVGLKAFVHLLDSDGAWITGGDDFAVEPATLRPGDIVLQLHSITIPAATAPGTYSLSVGLYTPASGNRIPLADGRDSAPVGEIRISSGG